MVCNKLKCSGCTVCHMGKTPASQSRLRKRPRGCVTAAGSMTGFFWVVIYLDHIAMAPNSETSWAVWRSLNFNTQQ